MQIDLWLVILYMMPGLISLSKTNISEGTAYFVLPFDSVEKAQGGLVRYKQGCDITNAFCRVLSGSRPFILPVGTKNDHQRDVQVYKETNRMYTLRARMYTSLK